MSEVELKRELQLFKVENERLKKLGVPSVTTVDRLGVVQQVAGVVDGYMALRSKVAELEADLATRNEDIRRLQAKVHCQAIKAEAK